MHVEYPPGQVVSGLVKRRKELTSRRVRQEFPHLEKRFWGRHFWAVGYGAGSGGKVTLQRVQEYLERDRHPGDQGRDTSSPNKWVGSGASSPPCIFSAGSFGRAGPQSSGAVGA